MLRGGGTGGPESSSSDEELDPVRVPILVTVHPVVSRSVGTAPFEHIVQVHSLQISTSTTIVEVSVAGLAEARPEVLLLFAEELVRSARERVRTGVILPVLPGS